MSYLKFDKVFLSNLQKSLNLEMLSANSCGAYSATTLIDCNTRKYHGLLVTPTGVSGNSQVLISSCDETIIQHGAEFHVGIHRYGDDYYSPKGHKYIREFNYDGVTTTIYRVGGVIMKKERVLMANENRVLVAYTLLESHSATTLRLTPFLSFREVSKLTYQNAGVNTEGMEVDHGMGWQMYDGYPRLFIQTNKHNEWHPQPNWYLNIEYGQDKAFGEEYREDEWVPGYFDMPIRNGETIILSIGLEAVSSRKLKGMFASEVEKLQPRDGFLNCLRYSAKQFFRKHDGRDYIVAGYPWLPCRARDQFVALAGLTLSQGDVALFESVMDSAIVELRRFMNGERFVGCLTEIDKPDILLWAIRAIQQYADCVGIESAVSRYSGFVAEAIDFIRSQKHPNLYVHSNGMVYVNGSEQPATWMNVVDHGRVVNPRTGYVVELNALWYNALQFAVRMLESDGRNSESDMLHYQAETLKHSFIERMWNGNYLYDYVDGDYANLEVRPNMVFAVSLPYTMLDRAQQKSVVDIITKELLTVRGLRSLSPKSGEYMPYHEEWNGDSKRNVHNGPAWQWFVASYAEAYLRVYGRSGKMFVEQMINGFDSQMMENTLATFSEFYDGNPPFRGHGAMSFAMNVGEMLRAFDVVERFNAMIEKTNF